MQPAEFKITFTPDVFTRFHEEQMALRDATQKDKLKEIKSAWVVYLSLGFLSGGLAQAIAIPWGIFWAIGFMIVMPFSYRTWLEFRNWKKEKQQLIKEGKEWVKKCDEVMLYRFIFSDDGVQLYMDDLEDFFKWDDFDSYISSEQLVQVWGQVKDKSFILLKDGMDEDDFFAIKSIIDEKMEGKSKYVFELE